jgi:hypothetical protein
VLSGRETIRNGAFAGYLPAAVMATRLENRWALAMCGMPMGWMKPILKQAYELVVAK